MFQARLKTGLGFLTAKTYGVLISPIWVLFIDTTRIIVEVLAYALVNFFAHFVLSVHRRCDRFAISPDGSTNSARANGSVNFPHRSLKPYERANDKLSIDEVFMVSIKPCRNAPSVFVEPHRLAHCLTLQAKIAEHRLG